MNTFSLKSDFHTLKIVDSWHENGIFSGGYATLGIDNPILFKIRANY